MPSGATTIIYSGVNGRAGAVFDGVDDFVAVTSSDTLRLPELSISCWVNRKEVGVFDDILHIVQTDNTDYLQIRILNNNKIVLTIEDGNVSVVDLTTDNAVMPNSNQWYHFICALEGGTWKMYIDGSLAASSGTNADIGTDVLTAWTTRIGKSNNQLHKGAMSDVKIYNRGLTATDVSDDFSGKTLKGIVSRWKLDTDYTDSVGTNDGTNNGSRLAIVDDKLATQVSNLRVNKNDKWFMSTQDKQLAITHIEEVT